MPAFAHSRPDHDETLVARLAAGDVDERERTTATVQLAACPACAQLHDDLRSIMAATADLPAPRRTRDFELTEADAARLRRTGWRAARPSCCPSKRICRSAVGKRWPQYDVVK